ncbi:MAG TPA: ATP-dependent RNA helicase HrpA [Tepidisphaeraceae bacterium]|nr:ATP-dependent RNA helicase HrpA [Tepidisphaeraceae bacterium]
MLRQEVKQEAPNPTLDVSACMLADQHRLRSRVRGIERSLEAGRPVEDALRTVTSEIERSRLRRQQRQARLPRPSFPDELPVVRKRAEIADAIRANQVVVITGETGSGKTTQLPKICLELGRGVAGMIGHTQPRRIAARSVSARIASELNTTLGQAVGYKIRFGDRTSPDTFVKVMTDGILLAETQGDRFLEQYDTLIIDEAHERSLNIDFLLGYLKQLLPKRPDLKLIITSATINPQQFSRHFDDAPIVEVSGRTYPVEARYRPAHEEEDDEGDDPIVSILHGVDEVCREGPGDVLVFLSGEREIRETAEALRQHHPPGTEILPLYARLSADEQNRVFQESGRRRIVLATNVAETSLTVPGIRYVVDPGYARISRYSPRTKVQRLPIERVSQASANQRKGRCGRVAEGICVRLYSEEDFNSRPRFTEPEILRTDLAAVILQMKALKLGEVQDFPFVEPPDYRSIKDGYQTLHELGAIDDRNELTDVGWALSKLPIDPRIGRMILAARDEGCMDEVLIIAAALSVQDPRERPMDKQELADAAHAQFRDEYSDFVGLLKLWHFYHEQANHLSHSRLRKMCQTNFLSFVRMREWHDIHQQLHGSVGEMGLTRGNGAGSGSGPFSFREKDRMRGRSRDESFSTTTPPHPDPPLEGEGVKARTPALRLTPQKYDAIHRAVLTGLLGNVGLRTDQFEYTGARGMKFHIFPGSGVFKTRPTWVVAAELVETTKLYARTIARIQPMWIERAAEHLVKRTYSEPHWSRQTAHVVAYEKVTLYGLPVVPKRTVHYGPIDPKLSREIFISSALVEGDYDTTAPYFRENARLVDEITTLEAKRRQRDVLVDGKVRYDFYDARIPAGITNGPAFEKWRRETEKPNPKLLHMTRRDLMQHGAADTTAELFPDVLTVEGLTLPLEYHLEPGHPADGVTAIIPLAALNQVPANRFEWLVPGLLKEKLTALIKSLPKQLRVHFVPAPDFAQQAFDKLKPDGSLCEALALFLSKTRGVTVRAADFDPASLLDHLHMNFAVVDQSQKRLATGRDLAALRKQFGVAAKETFAKPVEESPYHRDNLTRWDFGDLPESVEVKRAGMTLRGYPALIDHGGVVSMRLLDSPEAAQIAHRRGVRRLFMLQLEKEMRHLAQTLPDFARMALYYKPIGSSEELRDDLMAAIGDRAFGDEGDIRTQQAFADRAGVAWKQLAVAKAEVTQVALAALSEYHALTLKLSGPLPPLWAATANDVRQQLAHLMPKRFITQTPLQWLPHLPRFLKASHLRLQKLGDAGHVRDAQRSAEMAPLWKQYVERRERHRKEGVIDAALEQYRWMMEELRVSLFAQELKTSIPVSTKRLEAQWQLVKP